MVDRIGIDVGGTKIAGARLVGSAIAAQRRVAAPAEYKALLDAIAELVTDLDAGGVGATVGVGTPGTASTLTGEMINAHNTPLQGRPFARDLATRIGLDVRVANDANCFALSEAIDGAGAGAGSVFGIILGTGVGAGIVVDGQVVVGAGGTAGEFGHGSLPWPSVDELTSARNCTCGRRGCIETWLSGPALAADHEHATGIRLEPATIARQARSGDHDATLTMDRYYDRLARALSGVINLLDPEVIVLGGGVSNVGSLYTEVPPRLAAHVFGDRVATRLVANRHGDASGVRGAAWLWGS